MYFWGKGTHHPRHRLDMLSILGAYRTQVGRDEDLDATKRETLTIPGILFDRLLQHKSTSHEELEPGNPRGRNPHASSVAVLISKSYTHWGG